MSQRNHIHQEFAHFQQSSSDLSPLSAELDYHVQKADNKVK